ncbi:MAG: autotransporter-associated beta strand repeat-containing protein, partial [Verrucomicrobiae bacterium]|nr:autotransporter-associated beta strand repeat-containing protein [Verrucomicrobiae bacterium]
VTAGRTATISAGLAGTLGMEKTGAGTLVLTGVKTYTGGTTVTAGTLELNSSTADRSAINGALTVESGATLRIAGANYTGLGRLGAPVTSLNVNGGTVENTIECWVTGASVNLTGATLSGGNFQIISSGFNSFESPTSTTIASNLLIRKDYGSADLNLNVADGVAATDLLVTGNIGQVLAAGVVKDGPGTLVLEGANTYTGNTLVNDGTLEVAAASGLRFRPTANGTANGVSGTSTATLSFLGTVDLDLAAADLTDGNSWSLFDLATFSGPAPTLTPAAVTSGAGTFGKSGSTWTLIDGANTWAFSETTGALSLAVGASNDYETWGAPYGLAAGSEGGDLDNDGLTNFEEYAFGLVPNSGASVNPIAVPLDKGTGTFSYTRRDISLQDPVLTYSVWYS